MMKRLIRSVRDLGIEVTIDLDCDDLFMVSLRGVRAKRGGGRISLCGRGATPDAAALDYLQLIHGETLLDSRDALVVVMP